MKIKACLDSIGFQINDILRLIENQTGFTPKDLNVDGGVTANGYLMQFISNLSDLEVKVPEIAEFSALGVVLCAGQTLGIYVGQNNDPLTAFRSYFSEMTEVQRRKITAGWERAVQQI